MEASRALRIGLTGGIGSGKSCVAARLQALGAQLIDTDAIARSLAAPGGAAVAALRARFGDAAIGSDGGLDRAWMRARAFAEPREREALESILHPLIGAETEHRYRAAGAACTVFDVPLLVESGRWRSRVDRVLLVDCPVERQVQRVVRRSHWTPEAVRQVVAQQATRAQRRAVADAVIDNRGDSLDDLHAEVDALWRLWGPQSQDA